MGTANTAIVASSFGAVVAMCTTMVVFALGRYDRLRDRIDELRLDMQRMQQSLEEIRAEMRAGFSHLEARMEQMIREHLATFHGA
jgi:flagellar capping protein FliD